MIHDIWQTVRNGILLSNELLIDCHGHVYSHVQDENGETRRGEDDMLLWMDESGISMMICNCIEACHGEPPEGNDRMARLIEKHPDRFVGYMSVSPRFGETEMLAELEKHLLQGNHKGIKIHPQLSNYPANGKGYRPVWAFANEHELPVLSHTWQGGSQNEPPRFIAIAKEFPRAKIILGHSGGTLDGNESAIEAAKQADNLYLDLCCSLMPDGIIEQMVKEVGASRVLFGTDTQFFEGRAKIGQIAAARISDDDKRKIFGLNAKRLFDL